MTIRKQAKELLDGGRPGKASRLALSPLTLMGVVYGRAMLMRRAAYNSGLIKSRKAPVPVISVGNLTLGGTGKTPLCEYIALVLKSSGMKPALVSRGYKGAMEGRVAVVSTGEELLLGPKDAGDEPVLLAKRLPGVPVLLGKDRLKAVREAVRRFGTNVAVLDDAYQHLAIARNLNVLALDAARPFAAGSCIPRGMLREPQSALRDADVIVFTRADRADRERLETLKRKVGEMNPAAMLLTAVHEPESVTEPGGGATDTLLWLKTRKVLAFAGIGKPEGFFATLSNLGAAVTHTVEFEDHHEYSKADIDRLLNWAKLTNAEALVTTEKDAVKLERYLPLTLPLKVLTVRMKIEEGRDAFEQKILEAAKGARL